MDNPAHDRYSEMDSATGDAAMDSRQRRRSPKDPTTEILERARRIETRLTQLLIALGVHTDSQRPEFDPGGVSHGQASLKLPSPHCSMKEMIDSIPKDWHEPVGVFVGGDYVATIRRSGNRSA